MRWAPDLPSVDRAVDVQDILGDRRKDLASEKIAPSARAGGDRHMVDAEVAYVLRGNAAFGSLAI